MLGLLALGMLGALCDEGGYDGGYGYDDDDDDYGIPPTCTTEFRSAYPYRYNPVTGGWNEEEDEENGW